MDVARVPLLLLRPFDRRAVVLLGPDRGRVRLRHLAARLQLLGRRRGGHLARPGRGAQAQRDPCRVRRERGGHAREGPGDLERGVGGEISQLDEEREQLCEVLRHVRRGGGGARGRVRILQGLALALLFRPGQQRTALHRQRGDQHGEVRGESLVLLRRGTRVGHVLGPRDRPLEQDQQVTSVEVVDPGRGRGVLLGPAQRDPAAAAERARPERPRGEDRQRAAQHAPSSGSGRGHGGARGGGHGRILASGTPGSARTSHGHYPGADAAGPPEAAKSPI